MYMPFQRESLALLKRPKSTTDTSRSVKKIDTEHYVYIQRKQQKRKGKEQQRERVHGEERNSKNKKAEIQK